MATINFTNYADSVDAENYGDVSTYNLLKGRISLRRYTVR